MAILPDLPVTLFMAVFQIDKSKIGGILVLCNTQYLFFKGNHYKLVMTNIESQSLSPKRNR